MLLTKLQRDFMILTIGIEFPEANNKAGMGREFDLGRVFAFRFCLRLVIFPLAVLQFINLVLDRFAHPKFKITHGLSRLSKATTISWSNQLTRPSTHDPFDRDWPFCELITVQGVSAPGINLFSPIAELIADTA